MDGSGVKLSDSELHAEQGLTAIFLGVEGLEGPTV
jgi:hypothetical protein